MKINVTADIRNMPTKPITEHGYIVARQDITAGSADLWYWGFYTDKDRAERAAVEIRNGVVLETAPIIFRSKCLLKEKDLKRIRDDYLKQAESGVVFVNEYIEPVYPKSMDCEKCKYFRHEDNMRTCPSCGLDVHTDFENCPRCGKRIERKESKDGNCN